MSVDTHNQEASQLSHQFVQRYRLYVWLSSSSNILFFFGRINMFRDVTAIRHDKNTKLEKGQIFNPFTCFGSSCVPQSLIDHKGLTDAEKLTWIKLARLSGKRGMYKTSYDQLAIKIKKCKRSTINIINELTRKNFLKKIVPSKKDQVLRKHCNTYLFLWQDCFADSIVQDACPEKCLSETSVAQENLTNPPDVQKSHQPSSDPTQDLAKKSVQNLHTKKKKEEKNNTHKNKGLKEKSVCSPSANFEEKPIKQPGGISDYHQKVIEYIIANTEGIKNVGAYRRKLIELAKRGDLDTSIYDKALEEIKSARAAQSKQENILDRWFELSNSEKLDHLDYQTLKKLPRKEQRKLFALMIKRVRQRYWKKISNSLKISNNTNQHYFNPEDILSQQSMYFDRAISEQLRQKGFHFWEKYEELVGYLKKVKNRVLQEFVESFSNLSKNMTS